MAEDFTPPNTGDALSSMDGNSIRKLWQKTVDVAEQQEDFMGQFEGNSPMSVIQVKTETAAGRGQTITFTTRAGFYGPGKSGDARFAAETDFEEIKINSHPLRVDFLRNATRSNERMEEVMGMRNELRSGDAIELGKWMGREKSTRMMMMFRELGTGRNAVLAGGRSGIDALTSADILNYDEVLAVKAAMKPLGTQAVMKSMKRGEMCKRFLCIPPTPASFTLESDDAYQEALEQAGVRGDSNPLFDGSFVDLRGVRFRCHDPIDQDGYAWVGSPLAPKAYLGNAIAAATTTPIVVKGGGSAEAADKNVNYFAFFPNFNFEFLPNETLDDLNLLGTGTRYCLIVNPPNAATDPNKVGMFSYTTGNTGKQITTVKRLASVASGGNVTTLGLVKWDQGAWKGKHTATHAPGAAIIPCNAMGVPIAETLFLGARAAYRGYGKYRNHRSQDTHEGGFIFERYITSVFGQSLRKDTNGVCRGFVKFTSAVQYPEYQGIPTNITADNLSDV